MLIGMEQRMPNKSTDIVNLSIIKNLNRSVYFIKLSNLLNERYEKPATYSQDGINIKSWI